MLQKAFWKIYKINFLKLWIYEECFYNDNARKIYEQSMKEDMKKYWKKFDDTWKEKFIEKIMNHKINYKKTKKTEKA